MRVHFVNLLAVVKRRSTGFRCDQPVVDGLDYEVSGIKRLKVGVDSLGKILSEVRLGGAVILGIG